MIELTNSGLPIFLNEDGSLTLSPLLELESLSHRTRADMREYLANPESIADFKAPSIYDMYRGICFAKDKAEFEKRNIRFDITVFHPGLLGKEFCKTIGHYHPIVPGLNIHYPETYEVIKGRALFVAQKMDNNYENILDVFAAEVDEGQDIIFPPGYGHITINPTDEILITSNWSAANFKSDYEPMKKFHGAAYYAVKETNGPAFEANKNYKNVPAIKILNPKEMPKFGLIKNQPAYQTGQKTPNMLEFLNRPDLYIEPLSIHNCFSGL